MVVQIAVGLGALIVLFFGRHIIGGLFRLYRIVPVNEAHIRILQNRKDIFSSRDKKSAYWYIPFITKIHKLPLCNLAIPVNDIKLNDLNMAKFVCDIMCFVNINDIEKAVERLILTDTSTEMGFDFVKLSEDLRAIMESIGRTVATKQTILEIYKDRAKLDEAITKEVESVFPKWGIELVDLELKDLKDAHNSTIIYDIEVKVAAEINRDAKIRIAETTREAEVAKAIAEEDYRKRQIQKDEQIGIAEQKKNQMIAQMESEANIQKIEATRKLEVGQAGIEKQKTEQLAEAMKIKFTTEAEGEANKIRTIANADAERIKNIGLSEANIIQAKKEADAAGTLKLAEALKQFDEMAFNVKTLDIQKDILLGKYEALSSAIQKADIRWIMSGANANKFFGLNLDAEGGANFNQFLEESGLDFQKIKQSVIENIVDQKKKNQKIIEK